MAARCSPKQALADLSLPILDERRAVIRKSKAGARRAIVLVVVQALIAVHIAHWMSTGRTMTPLEPSEAMQFSKASVVNAGLIFFALTIASTFLLGRWFCGWACHLVALQDGSRWLLEKIGLRPRPANLGILGAVPWAAFVYMFLAPVIQKLIHGAPVAASGMRLTTDRFWATFPSWPVALATFLVCGFVIVYLLGAKGFCNYACPYGAIFGIADQLSPLRIRVNDACEGCGHCTAVCTSNVRVHEEVRDFGAVVDPACMKCLDCVSVCPKDALRIGFGAPAMFTSRREGARPAIGAGLGKTLLDLALVGAFLAGCFAVFLDFDRDLDLIPDVGRLLAVLTGFALVVAAVFRGKARRTREYSTAEEALLGGFFLLALYSVRGFRGSVPLLFALGLASILAFLAVQGLRLFYRREMIVQRHLLRSAGRLTAAGTLFAGALLPVGAVWSYAGWSRHTLRSSYDDGLRFAGAGRTDDAIAALRRAVEVDPGYRDAQEKLASLLCDSDRLKEGIATYRMVVARTPERLQTRMLLAGALFQTGDGKGAREELEQVVALAPTSPVPHRMLAELCTSLGDAECAKREEETAQQLEAASAR
jgi:tetratricopeptide (TPR) repeat protein/NAD-dependent dihydropyrimidine dehydrogenase PreA subunit